MRVHFVLPPIERFSPVAGGAISTFAWQMARRLIDAGHEAVVISPTEGEPVYEDVPSVTFASAERDGLGVIRRAMSKADRVWRGRDWMYYDVYINRLVKACRSLPQPDWWFGFNDLQIGMMLKERGLGGRMAIRLSNECRTQYPDPSAVFAAYNQVFAVSGYIKSWTCEQYHPVTSSLIDVLPNGADLEHFFPRQGFDSTVDEVKVLFVGRIDPNKGPDLAADAVVRLRQQGLRVSMTVAGARWFGQDHEAATPYESRLNQAVTDHGGRIMGHVPRAEVPALIREHDIASVLSRSQEPMSQFTFEAMASGCAVLASNRGGTPEALGDAGVQIDPDDFEEVIEALARLVRDPEWLAEQKRLSVARASTMSWNHTFRQLSDRLSIPNTNSPNKPMRDPKTRTLQRID